MDSRPVDDKHLLPVSKGLVMAHLNVCSIRNKVHELKGWVWNSLFGHFGKIT